jgi:hypothetical protein
MDAADKRSRAGVPKLFIKLVAEDCRHLPLLLMRRVQFVATGPPDMANFKA